MLTRVSGARIFDGQNFHDDHVLVINDEKIVGIEPRTSTAATEDCAVIELDGGIIAPGFIDLQVNGGGGKLFNNDPSMATLSAMLHGHRMYGTTTMTPTLISDSTEQHQAGVSVIQQAIAENMKGILGVHIEGPFFNIERRGTHKAEFIRNPTESDIAWVCEASQATPAMVTIVTLAPERAEKGQIAKLVESGVVVCAGHTDGYYADVKAALEEGLSGFTHLFNAMRPLTGREPGVVGAALEDKNSWCGIIADGHHVHPSTLAVAIAAKPKGKVFIVTDAMATIGHPDKSFELYGEVIKEQDGCLINAEGRLAGSAISMIDSVRYAVEGIGLTLDEALRMASLYPAQFVGRASELGQIVENYRADLVHFDQNYVVKNTWVAGQHEAHLEHV
ncbi:N-acetylglucosamine-6-phosphate deacetylase [Thalassocella blandensis]|nr:N-acetylglucosamine-6-phosphate deacetylase [Thalassocella blandensis]